MLRSVLAVALLVIATGCTEAPSGAAPAVHRLRLTRTGDAYPVVSGVLVNRSSESFTSADVFLTLYDADNLPFPQPHLVSVRGLAAGDSARFEGRLDVQARRVSLKLISVN